MLSKPLQNAFSKRTLLTTLLVLLVLLSARSSTLAQAPPPPTLLSPANYTVTDGSNYLPLGVPIFTWQAVDGADSYEIEIDDDINFTDPSHIGTPLTFYAPPQVNAYWDGNYWWRVRTRVGGEVGPWSQTWTFEKRWGDVSAPTLLAPADSATLEFLEAPTFSWEPVVGAARYHLLLSKDYNFGDLWGNWYTPYTSFTPNSRPEDGLYYWQVYAVDAAGHKEGLSEVRSFTLDYDRVPTLLEPIDNALPEFTPTFRWTAVKGGWEYKLQYGTTSDFTAHYREVNTSNTTFTPEESLANDVNYYWRVRVRHGSVGEYGPWSETRSFLKRWHTDQHRVELLTPRDQNLVNYPFLHSWTPAREAAYYDFELCRNTSCTGGHVARTNVRGTTLYSQWHMPTDIWGETLYWRVTPYDNSGNPGAPSEWASYRPRFYWDEIGGQLAYQAELVSPRFYYDPPSGYADDDTRQIQTHYDPTSPLPTFTWARVFSTTYNEVDHFVLQVSTSPSNFNPPSLQWDYETRNTSATPTDADPFTPTVGTDYYWRVLAYDENDQQIGIRSEIWKTRIDASLMVTPTDASSPALSYPLHAQEIMELTPSLRWLPMQGAAGYLLEIHREPDCSDSALYSVTTRYVEHTLPLRLPPDTYFWRVRALDSGGAPTGAWSATHRFLIEFQSRWKAQRWTSPTSPSPGDIMTAISRTLIATDTVEAANSDYDLQDLYAGRDEDNWYIGFHIVTPTTSGQPVWYGLYLDNNQEDNQGADAPPPNSPGITAPFYHRPEFALYVTRDGSGDVVTNYVAFHDWDLDRLQWDYGGERDLLDPVEIGGAIYVDNSSGYVELRIPKSPLGNPGSLSIALFSTQGGSATQARDTVPDSGEDVAVVDRLASLADRVTLIYPDPLPLAGGVGFDDSPPLVWQTADVDYFRGYRVELSLNEDFSPIYDFKEGTCENCFPWVDIGPIGYTRLTPLPNNTYFWRVKVRHRDGIDYYGEPTDPMFFTKVGLVPHNLQISVDYTIPTFSWDSVEGAAAYRLQISSSPKFSTPAVNIAVNHNQYTPLANLALQTWYWRVRVENGSYAGEWSEPQSFTLTLPTPQLVSPIDEAVIEYGPTFQWGTVLTPTVQPIFHPRFYRLQVCRDENCTDIVRQVDTLTTLYTPDASLFNDRDAYYWRVAVINTGGRVGPYSPVRSFTKQAATVTLTSPGPGEALSETRVFYWEPVEGASYYQIEIAKNPYYSPIYDSGNVHNAFFAPVKKYDLGVDYWWRVRACDADNKCGPWQEGLLSPFGNKLYLPLVLRNAS